MTALWAAFMEVFQVGLFGLTQFYGGHLGAAIVSFSLLARLALLPVGVRMTLRARAQARRLKGLQPRIEKVRARWVDDPRRLMNETMAVYERAGVKPVDPGLFKSAIVQTPVFLGIFHAVRAAIAGRAGAQPFLWVASLARPDIGVAALAVGLMGLSSGAGASQNQPGWMLAIPAVSAGIMALTLSAGFGLYLAATGMVGTLQGLIVRRIESGYVGREG